jgi:phosphoglycolate phosphatase-like HAD superfamily hydrolase
VSVSVLLDVDGTLVDSNYQHVLAWQRAFAEHGLVPGNWRIHRHIGMGGDKLVPELVGDDVERRIGDELRAGWRRHIEPMLDEVAPVTGARELLVALTERDATVVLASSGPAEHVERWVDLLDARDLVDGRTTSDDAEESKPAPDLFAIARDRAGSGPAVAVGDATWDCEAAERLGVPSYGLRTGGFSVEELRAAGAQEVYDDLPSLTADLDRVLSR